ncbi:sarcosine oxidase subunit gamma [Amycolatopsis thermoflava]|uniref:sarcosine oxidase subunit gamma n=1 Tax=Amycolatopsis thermoflava TaxID=84480 RepID=UPI003EBB223E
MADPRLYPTRPLQQWIPSLAAASRNATGLNLEAEPPVAAVDLRVTPPADVLGTPLPTEPNTWVYAADGQIVWLGPDEWLVTSTAAQGHELEARLGAVVRPRGGAATDVSAQRTGIRVSGRHARDLLATGCALDLHPLAFPAGSAAQTTLGQAPVLLLALGAGEDFRVFVRPSFAGYLADWLLDAALEFQPAGATS